MLDQGFEPWSSARKAKMIGRTTPIERSALQRMERGYINFITRGDSADASHGFRCCQAAVVTMLLAGELGVVIVHKRRHPFEQIVGVHEMAERLGFDFQAGLTTVAAGHHRSLGELLGDRWAGS